MSAGFILVASYPKSGNTWTRIVFERLRNGADFPINALAAQAYGASLRRTFDSIAPAEAADLLPNEIDEFLPDVYRHVAAELGAPLFVKVHDAARRTRSGEWLFPPDCVRSVVYVARHPFDVAVSAAHHFGIPVEKAVAFMGDETVMPRALERLPEALAQSYGTWTQNVSSWLDASPYTVSFARYEDLLADPLGEFRRLARATDIEAADGQLRRVVEASRFEQLQKDESEHGFFERPKSSPRFFRAGKARAWEGVLDQALRETLLRDHGPMMERLGYDADGGARPLPAPLQRDHSAS